jgi:predicted membrane protein
MNDEFETISAKIFDVFAYIHSRWFYFKIALITMGSVISLLIIITIITKIARLCKKCKHKKKNETKEKNNNTKSVNMIKSFLVKPKGINSIQLRRHSTDSCCLDPATNSLLERIEKQNYELYKKARFNNE